MNNSTWFAATVMIGVVGLATSAHADSLQPSPRRAPSMQEIVTLGSARSVTFDRLAEDIKQKIHAPAEDNIITIDEAFQSSFINDFLDDNGDFNLPLGITVYDTMGDTSIGFGTQF
jgi:hypothetical protein